MIKWIRYSAPHFSPSLLDNMMPTTRNGGMLLFNFIQTFILRSKLGQCFRVMGRIVHYIKFNCIPKETHFRENK